ncbi:coiled-coil domain-containing protein R3HCC1L [Trichonephila clavipes]|nr:coiled-coil domain-containing protein R3HCC1L [Trichonephila clavipes]
MAAIYNRLPGIPWKEKCPPFPAVGLEKEGQSCYCIKWVDDCHALAVFTSPSIANQALLLTHPFVKARPLSEGLKESKAKARWCARHSEPPKPRPATTAALARRLVSGALGLKVQATKEQKELERNMLKNARALNALLPKILWPRLPGDHGPELKAAILESWAQVLAPLKTHRVENLMFIKSIEVQSLHVGVVLVI